MSSLTAQFTFRKVYINHQISLQTAKFSFRTDVFITRKAKKARTLKDDKPLWRPCGHSVPLPSSSHLLQWQPLSWSPGQSWVPGHHGIPQPGGRSPPAAL